MAVSGGRSGVGKGSEGSLLVFRPHEHAAKPGFPRRPRCTFMAEASEERLRLLRTALAIPVPQESSSGPRHSRNSRRTATTTVPSNATPPTRRKTQNASGTLWLSLVEDEGQ